MREREGRFCVILANFVLVASPAVWLGTELFCSVRFWSFAVGATLLCLADLARQSVAQSLDRLPTAPGLKWVCGLTGLALLLCWWLSLTFRNADPNWTQTAIGFGMMLMGAGIRIRAVVQLGGDFVSDVQPGSASSLHVHGVYARIRHPSELGLLLAALGGCTLLGSWAGAAIWLLGLVPLSLVRVASEETRLRATFGVAYGQYSNRTGRFWPRYVTHPTSSRDY